MGMSCNEKDSNLLQVSKREHEKLITVRAAHFFRTLLCNQPFQPVICVPAYSWKNFKITSPRITTEPTHRAVHLSISNEPLDSGWSQQHSYSYIHRLLRHACLSSRLQTASRPTEAPTDLLMNFLSSTVRPKTFKSRTLLKICSLTHAKVSPDVLIVN